MDKRKTNTAMTYWSKLSLADVLLIPTEDFSAFIRVIEHRKRRTIKRGGEK